MTIQGAKFREMLKDQPFVAAPGVYDPLTAKISERAGADCLYLSGYSTSLGRYGKGDLGFVHRDEMVEVAERVVEETNVPVISDADEGYGNAPQLQYTVEKFIRAGVAGVHLEDQPGPKRCGHISGKRVIPIEEAVGKIQAACDVRDRLAPDFVIIARTDAFSAVGEGPGYARQRLIEYWEAGADLLWCEFPSPDRETARKMAADIRHSCPDAQFAFNYSSSFRWDKEEFPMTFGELAEFGYKYIFITLFALHAATLSVDSWVRRFVSEGGQAQVKMNAIKTNTPTASHHKMGDVDKYLEIERRFSPWAKKAQGTDGFGSK